MSGNLIDQLTVKLGLDPSDFKKGVGEAKKALDELKSSSAEAGSAVGDMIGGGAKKATGGLGMLGSILGKGGAIGLGIGATLFLAEKLDSAMFKVAVSLRQVNIEGKNVGQTAAGLRNLQNASELAGGSMEDAAQTVGDLQKSLFNLRFNGQVSEQIIMLSRLGVQFQDSYGRARDFNDVMLDTADALDKAQKSGQMTRPEAAIFAQQAGFTGGMQQLVLSGRGGVQSSLDKQRARTQITDEMTAAGTREVNASVSFGQARESEIWNRGVGAEGNGRAAVQEELERIVTHPVEELGKAAEKAAVALERIASVLPTNVGADLARRLFGGASLPASGSWGSISAANREAMLQPAIRAAAGKYGVREDVLHGIIQRESNFNPDAKSPKSSSRGVAGLLKGTGGDLGVTPGKDPIADIDAAARYLKQLHSTSKRYLGDDAGETMPYIMAVKAYHDGMGNVRKGIHPDADSLSYPEKVLQGIPDLEGAARDSANVGTVNNDVQISQITVNTQATDAEGIAGDIGPATRRKLLAAHAETGITP